MQVGIVWRGIIFLTVAQILIGRVLLAPSCMQGQKLRINKNGEHICCNTTSCNISQQFEPCKLDQGYDVCKDCPAGSYTNKTINTDDWDAETNVCIALPNCTAEEIMIGNTCQCDLEKGYYGNLDNCTLDTSCNKEGFQLQYDGSCVPCDSDHFKPEDGTHGVCRNKTRCKEDETETSSGTLTTDRICSKFYVDNTTAHSNATENQTSVVSLSVGIAVTVFVMVVMTVIVFKCNMRKKYLRRIHVTDVDKICKSSHGAEISHLIHKRNARSYSPGTTGITNVVETRPKTMAVRTDKTGQPDSLLPLKERSLFQKSDNLTNERSDSCIVQELADSSTQNTAILDIAEGKFRFVTTDSENGTTSLKNVFVSFRTAEGETPRDEKFHTAVNKQSIPVGFEVTDKLEKENTTMLSDTSPEFYGKEYLYTVLKDGSYDGYGNRIYLAGPSSAGKTTLASCLLGKDIPYKEILSTNWLEIYFGRNGIDLSSKKMIPIEEDAIGHPLYCHVITDLKKRKNLQSDKEATRMHDRSMTILPTPIGSAGIHETEKTETFTNKLDLVTHTLADDTMHQTVLKELKGGRYKIPIAPSDLVDFGGQKAYDLIQQLLILQNGTVLLMFDGRNNMQDRLPQYSQEVTTASILIQWVNSILAFCKEPEDGMPKIQFVATHRDYYDEGLEERRIDLQSQIRKLFYGHKKQHHLYYDPLFFINATNRTDEEIARLKDRLVKFAFSQTSWGRKMPLSWVPLEHQILEMKHNGKPILSMDEIISLNAKNESFIMDEENLILFLKVQDALGKLLFFQEDDLANFVITDPTFLSNITNKLFFQKKENDYRLILKGLQENGTIKKVDLRCIGKQSFSFPPEYHDYLVKLLLHLDFLVEPPLSPRESDYFIIPSMVETTLNNDFANRYFTADKSICMSYVLSTNIVPPVLLFRLIAAAGGLWPLTKYMGRDMIFSDVAIFTVEDRNTLSVMVNKNRIIVYFTNMDTINDIPIDYVSSVKEFLTSSLDSIIQFYQMRYGRMETPDENDEKLYKLEYGVTCQNGPCFIQPEELMLLKSGTWKCKHGQLHNVVYLRYWENAKHKKQNNKFQQTESMTTKPPFDLQKKVAFAVGTEVEQLGLHLGVDITVVKKYLRKKGLNMFHKNFRILKHVELVSAANFTVQRLINAMEQIGGRGLDTVYRYYRRRNELDGTGDENLLRIYRTITDVNVKQQRSKSICAVYTAGFYVARVEKDWFYKLNILVDDYNLHLINDLRLQKKYIMLHNELRNTGNYLLNTSLSYESVFSEFELIYQQINGSKTLTICDCVDNNLDLTCRFLLAKDVAPLKLKEALTMAMNKQSPQIAKAIAWCLTRKFVQGFKPTQFLRDINDIWPGFYCLCKKNEGKGHSKMCSQDLVIIVEVKKQISGMQDDFLGVPVKQISTSFGQTVAEHKQVHDDEMNTNEESKTPTIESDIAEMYFKKHTKLTMMYILPGKPIRVQFYCQIKQTIPIGEDHFPLTVLEFDTNVEEGYVNFLTKIRIGDKIGLLTSSGTLGGFVQMHGFNAFLTCAHVVYDRKSLLAGNKRERHRERTKVFCLDIENKQGIECGYVFNWAFEHDSKKETSVDAAVVILKENIKSIDENDIVRDRSGNPKSVEFLGMKGPYLNDNYITNKIWSGVMKARSVGIASGFYEGIIAFEDYDADEELFKDKAHGITLYFEDLSTQIQEIEKKTQRHSDMTHEAHFQLYVLPELEDSLRFDRRYFRFYHQLLLDNFSFKLGDSGTCIYVTEDQTTQRPDCQPNPTGCLAMAIASFHDKKDGKEKCIATPMKAILKTLGLI